MEIRGEGAYPVFMVNRALSYHPDTLVAAQQTNRWSHVPARLQYDYLLLEVRSSRRFAKWAKRSNADEDLAAVSTYLGLSPQKSKEAVAAISRAGLDEIKRRLATRES